MLGCHREGHRTERISWLRPAVLGANDGIISLASLVLGIAAAHGTSGNIVIAGVAGLGAGAMSMAAPYILGRLSSKPASPWISLSW